MRERIEYREQLAMKFAELHDTEHEKINRANHKIVTAIRTLPLVEYFSI